MFCMILQWDSHVNGMLLNDSIEKQYNLSGLMKITFKGEHMGTPQAVVKQLSLRFFLISKLTFLCPSF